MKFIMKHKVILIIAFLICFILVLSYILFDKFILSDRFGSIYGTRLEGMEKYSVTEKNIGEISNKFKSANGLEDISYDMSGKIVNFILYFKGDTELSAAKDVASKLLDDFSDSEKEYFEFQVFIVNEKKEGFPKIGYKHASSNILNWSN